MVTKKKVIGRTVLVLIILALLIGFRWNIANFWIDWMQFWDYLFEFFV